ncbi:hypothetical protein SCLCIDRAFT_294549 [Scleroderma citrinum Foug A]|uniref:Uncharacterized protein n=1 Tax=Scleroderma citrinum Foug A TaxID=1036808 RepID=A0A0C3EFL7_9AGAM|nr:hypothetical protein SCLCIDRAFT_294549 [Scleroderma citrinum Foug A]
MYKMNFGSAHLNSVTNLAEDSVTRDHEFHLVAFSFRRALHHCCFGHSQQPSGGLSLVLVIGKKVVIRHATPVRPQSTSDTIYWAHKFLFQRATGP